MVTEIGCCWILLNYSNELLLMSRCWSAIPLAKRAGTGSKSNGAALEDLLFNFGLNHLLNVRPLILILPWDSSPWYTIPNRLRREPTAWPILYDTIQISLFKKLSNYFNGYLRITIQADLMPNVKSQLMINIYNICRWASIGNPFKAPKYLKKIGSTPPINCHP